MPHSYDYDAIVIGSGPGGEGAAMGLVKQGARVAVIERSATPLAALSNLTRILFTATTPDFFVPLLPTS